MARLERHTHGGKTAEPGPQQGRRLHGFRKHAAARSHEGRLAKLGAEGAQVVGGKRFDCGPDVRLGVSVAAQELVERFAVRQIETATTRQQKLAADGRHLVVDGDARAAAHKHVARHQAGRPASDNRDMTFVRAIHGAVLEHVPLELARSEHDPETWEPVFGTDPARAMPIDTTVTATRVESASARVANSSIGLGEELCVGLVNMTDLRESGGGGRWVVAKLYPDTGAHSSGLGRSRW